jgi:hypothetical protein
MRERPTVCVVIVPVSWGGNPAVEVDRERPQRLFRARAADPGVRPAELPGVIRRSRAITPVLSSAANRSAAVPYGDPARWPAAVMGLAPGLGGWRGGGQRGAVAVGGQSAGRACGSAGHHPRHLVPNLGKHVPSPAQSRSPAAPVAHPRACSPGYGRETLPPFRLGRDGFEPGPYFRRTRPFRTPRYAFACGKEGQSATRAGADTPQGTRATGSRYPARRLAPTTRLAVR